MMDAGLNMEVDALGNTKKTLRIKYALMSKAFIYQLRNKADLDQTAQALGFNKIIFTDGFDSTWTVALK